MVRRLIGLWLAVISFAACSRGDSSTVQQQTRSASAPSVAAPRQPTSQASRASSAPRAPDTRYASVGFRSRAQFNEHFQKHGAEFGQVTQDEYLRLAQSVRDAPAGGSVEEIRRDDGTTSRFDRSTGAFIAFNGDRTIRTFFKPNDGEAYFRRQAKRVH